MPSDLCARNRNIADFSSSGQRGRGTRSSGSTLALSQAAGGGPSNHRRIVGAQVHAAAQQSGSHVSCKGRSARCAIAGWRRRRRQRPAPVLPDLENSVPELRQRLANAFFQSFGNRLLKRGADIGNILSLAKSMASFAMRTAVLRPEKEKSSRFSPRMGRGKAKRCGIA